MNLEGDFRFLWLLSTTTLHFSCLVNFYIFGLEQFVISLNDIFFLKEKYKENFNKLC